jgi:O-acetyl-ADP-ribose deacetylase (regulator of RNase III)
MLAPIQVEIVAGNITTIAADAIVNAAKNSLLGGGGVDGAIHRAGGSAILEECRDIIACQGGCNTGEAVITTAGNLPAKYVIHTVGPIWNGGLNDEFEQLASCYKNSLQLAADNGCKTVAFPNISTGIYGFPKDKAAVVAIETVANFLTHTNKIDKVLFVCFDKENERYLTDQLIKRTKSRL